MTDLDLDAILDDDKPVPVESAVALMADVSQRLREGLAAIVGFDVAKASPDRRQELADFRDFLLDMKEPISLWLNRIDALFRDAGQRTGIRKFPLLDGRDVILDEPGTTYQVEEAALRSALLVFVRDGLLTVEDVDKAVKPETVYKVDNRVLNTLHRNRGNEVAATIDQYRQKVEPIVSQAKVVYPRRSAKR